jgi:hypothetical protein
MGGVADSPAVRQARHQAHKQGRHHLCRLETCPDAMEPRDSTGEPDADGLEEATEQYLSGEISLIELRGAIVLASARAADKNPSPGMLRAFADALQAYRHVSNR